jgi:hypothetical protein
VQDVARMLNALIGIFTICGGFIVTTTTPQLRNVEHSIVQSAVGTMLKLASLIWGKQYLMTNLNLTKEAIKRLYNSPVEVRLVNGCYNVATAEAKFSRHIFELRVQYVPPFITWLCGTQNEVSFWFYRGGSGLGTPVPSILEPLVKKLTEAAKMSDEEEKLVVKQYKESFKRAMDEMGFV